MVEGIHRSSLKTYLRKKLSRKDAKTPSKNKMISFYIPARPFMKLNESDLNKIKISIVNELTKEG